METMAILLRLNDTLASAPKWTDVAQAIASIGTLVVGIIAFGAVMLQLRQVKSAIRSNTHSSLYNQSMETMRLIFQQPEFWPYIYDGKELSKDDQHFFALRTLVEIIADFFTHVTLQKNNLPVEGWLRWKEYICSVYKSCPLLREHLSQNARWYSKDILDVVQELDLKQNISQPPLGSKLAGS